MIKVDCSRAHEAIRQIARAFREVGEAIARMATEIGRAFREDPAGSIRIYALLLGALFVVMFWVAIIIAAFNIAPPFGMILVGLPLLFFSTYHPK